MTTLELTGSNIFRAISTLENSDQVFAAIRKGCKNIDFQGFNEQFGQKFAQTKRNFFQIQEERPKKILINKKPPAMICTPKSGHGKKPSSTFLF